ncbi:MAG: HAD-IA family hydrolase [Clostridia bacterium]|nr:HAD-IA family hydrolase [Clostridia bacterium]
MNCNNKENNKENHGYKIKNIIFDFDGCIIDSTQVQKDAFFGSYAEIIGDDKCPSYEEYIKHTGNSVEGVLELLHLPLEMAAPFRRISRASVGKIKVNWDLIELIKKLKKYGSKIAICTGKDHDRTLEILKYYDIDSYFDTLICADDVKEHKPSPEPIYMAIRSLGVSNESCYMVGDGYSDIKSAQNAGIKSVLTLWYGDNGVPKVADYTVDNVSDLEKILRSNA